MGNTWAEKMDDEPVKVGARAGGGGVGGMRVDGEQFTMVFSMSAARQTAGLALVGRVWAAWRPRVNLPPTAPSSTTIHTDPATI